jgi:hypothetical protein
VLFILEIEGMAGGRDGAGNFVFMITGLGFAAGNACLSRANKRVCQRRMTLE